MGRKKIVCIGDSLTAGYGVETNERWTSVLSNTLNLDIVNSGISGDTTAGMLARFHEMVINHKPDYVIITGGTNDVLLHLPNNIIIANILAMTRLAKHYNVIPLIGIPTSYFIFDTSANENLFIDMEAQSIGIQSYQKALKEFALNDNQFYIDFSLNLNSELFLSDGLHPNIHGHNQMALNACLVLDNIS